MQKIDYTFVSLEPYVFGLEQYFNHVDHL
jgi:hypothetical protein